MKQREMGRGKKGKTLKREGIGFFKCIQPKKERVGSVWWRILIASYSNPLSVPRANLWPLRSI